jgi:hypothetical protein
MKKHLQSSQKKNLISNTLHCSVYRGHRLCKPQNLFFNHNFNVLSPVDWKDIKENTSEHDKCCSTLYFSIINVWSVNEKWTLQVGLVVSNLVMNFLDVPSQL